MRIKPEQLRAQLNQKLARLYLVFGAEVLLTEQSLSLIKTNAKRQEFHDKITFEIDANFNWDQVVSELSAASLFSPKRIIECRLKSGKIGLKGSKALSKIASTLPDDILLIVSTGKLDAAQQKSKWFKTLEKYGDVVQNWEVQSNHLVGWISNHMAQLGLETNAEIAQNIAFCTEGNLLAAMQEIQKLQMAYPDGKIDAKTYQAQLNQQSQYTIYGLIDCALSGNRAQMLKIYRSLSSDAAMPIRLSYSLYQEIKTLIDMSIALHQTQNMSTILQNHRVWQKRKPMIERTLKRHSYQRLQKLLLSLGHIDRAIKGMDGLNVIDELRILLLNLAR